MLRAADKTLPARDRWQGEFVFAVIGDALQVSCAGPDRQFDTPDDVSGHPVSPDPHGMRKGV